MKTYAVYSRDQRTGALEQTARVAANIRAVLDCEPGQVLAIEEASDEATDILEYGRQFIERRIAHITNYPSLIPGESWSPGADMRTPAEALRDRMLRYEQADLPTFRLYYEIANTRGLFAYDHRSNKIEDAVAEFRAQNQYSGMTIVAAEPLMPIWTAGNSSVYYGRIAYIRSGRVPNSWFARVRLDDEKTIIRFRAYIRREEGVGLSSREVFAPSLIEAVVSTEEICKRRDKLLVGVEPYQPGPTKERVATIRTGSVPNSWCVASDEDEATAWAGGKPKFTVTPEEKPTVGTNWQKISNGSIGIGGPEIWKSKLPRSVKIDGSTLYGSPDLDITGTALFAGGAPITVRAFKNGKEVTVLYHEDGNTPMKPDTVPPESRYVEAPFDPHTAWNATRIAAGDPERGPKEPPPVDTRHLSCRDYAAKRCACAPGECGKPKEKILSAKDEDDIYAAIVASMCVTINGGGK